MIFIKQYYDALPTKEVKLNKEFNKIIHKLKMHVGHDLLEESELPPEKKSIRGRPKKLFDTTRQYDKDFPKLLHEKFKMRNTMYITRTNLSRHKKSPYCIAYGLKETENN